MLCMVNTFLHSLIPPQCLHSHLSPKTSLTAESAADCSAGMTFPHGMLNRKGLNITPREMKGSTRS